MRNSESTMYLVPCDTCGHGFDKHGSTVSDKCYIYVCDCERFVEPTKARRRVNGRFVKSDATTEN